MSTLESELMKKAQIMRALNVRLSETAWLSRGGGEAEAKDLLDERLVLFLADQNWMGSYICRASDSRATVAGERKIERIIQRRLPNKYPKGCHAQSSRYAEAKIAS